MALSRRDVFPSMPSKAGRRGPFRAPDTGPSLGKGARGIRSSGPMPLLSSACVEVPLVTTLKCWFARAFSRPCARCRSRGLSSASVTSVGVVPWRHSLRVCCANPTARAISDMAVGPNPDSNPGLSDLRRRTNDIELGPVGAAGSNPGCANREVENFSDELEPGTNPGRANRRFF